MGLMGNDPSFNLSKKMSLSYHQKIKTIHLYSYVNNNPTNFIDPFGLFTGDTWTNPLKKCHELNKDTAKRCQCFCDLQPIADTTRCIESCNNCYELFENRSAVGLCKCLCKEQGKDEKACNCMCEGFKGL